MSMLKGLPTNAPATTTDYEAFTPIPTHFRSENNDPPLNLFFYLSNVLTLRFCSANSMITQYCLLPECPFICRLALLWRHWTAFVCHEATSWKHRVNCLRKLVLLLVVNLLTKHVVSSYEAFHPLSKYISTGYLKIRQDEHVWSNQS